MFPDFHIIELIDVGTNGTTTTNQNAPEILTTPAFTYTDPPQNIVPARASDIIQSSQFKPVHVLVTLFAILIFI